MAAPRTLAVDYDLYEVAYLAGGPRRAVDVAVVALVESGRVDVDRSTGQFSVVDARHRHAWALLEHDRRRLGEHRLDVAELRRDGATSHGVVYDIAG